MKLLKKSRILDVEKNISAKNQGYTNDEISSMIMSENLEILVAILLGKAILVN